MWYFFNKKKRVKYYGKKVGATVFPWEMNWLQKVEIHAPMNIVIFIIILLLLLLLLLLLSGLTENGGRRDKGAPL